MWHCSAILSGASLECAALFWGLESPGADSLNVLSEALELHMRSPSFLRLMHSCLNLISNPTFFAFPV